MSTNHCGNHSTMSTHQRMKRLRSNPSRRTVAARETEVTDEYRPLSVDQAPDRQPRSLCASALHVLPVGRIVLSCVTLRQKVNSNSVRAIEDSKI